MREFELREPAVFDRDAVVRDAVVRDAVVRDALARDDARRGVVAVRFAAVERVARLGVGLRGVTADLRSLTSLLHSSRADHAKQREVRDQLHR
ncbi:unannotated protein [freshwater metagenome]|uniref:Unannotated protein n=1 Tax=freshwater metagenome TaxID=449393 RepID=A0A6J7EXE8_9ZZZZ